jgi:hypothetical protein
MAQSRSGYQRPGSQGISSKNVVHPSVRTGSGSKSTRPAGVAMFGQMQGSHVTSHRESDYRGEPLHNDRNFQPTKFGNEIAANTVCKPGGSREVMRSDQQGTHGSVNRGNPQPQQGDILSQYGPESKRR